MIRDFKSHTGTPSKWVNSSSTHTIQSLVHSSLTPVHLYIHIKWTFVALRIQTHTSWLLSVMILNRKYCTLAWCMRLYWLKFTIQFLPFSMIHYQNVMPHSVLLILESPSWIYCFICIQKSFLRRIQWIWTVLLKIWE